MALVGITFCSQAWLGPVVPAQAAPVTDTLELQATLREWCHGNPKFFQNIKIRTVYNVTVAITRDVNNIQATINTTGLVADIDAITMTGLAFPSNKSGTKAELILSGVHPGNADHFFTIRGHAMFDALGQMTNLTKVTGTFVYQITDMYAVNGNLSQPVECLASGTFGTGKKIP
jgi:hypothetical protein